MCPTQVGRAVWTAFRDMDIRNFWDFQKKALLRSVLLVIMVISGYNLCKIAYEKGEDKARQDLKQEQAEVKQGESIS
ncbi:hypothetical protein M433DRAFT_151078 [Acidomyces richmondensis BFW]|nr:MAG: hypothetical protein FE78DRAFT_84676 [Acidomyces sp. 'richmondensis']KYG48476.1 hypothetical protein M433DRAFT_151078 [Acidomyces richmondensis BFW]